MKQHITQKQHLELNKDQSDYLLGWMSNRGYYDCGEVNLTIGIMIEFLDEHNAINIDLWKEIYYKHEIVGICDALWEAVKEVLKTKKELV
jgi:phage-related protein